MLRLEHLDGCESVFIDDVNYGYIHSFMNGGKYAWMCAGKYVWEFDTRDDLIHTLMDVAILACEPSLLGSDCVRSWLDALMHRSPYLSTDE